MKRGGDMIPRSEAFDEFSSIIGNSGKRLEGGFRKD